MNGFNLASGLSVGYLTYQRHWGLKHPQDSINPIYHRAIRRFQVYNTVSYKEHDLVQTLKNELPNHWNLNKDTFIEKNDADRINWSKVYESVIKDPATKNSYFVTNIMRDNSTFIKNLEAKNYRDNEFTRIQENYEKEQKSKK